MKQERVKQSIKKKFGTLSKFCRITGYDRMKLQILFAVKHPEPMELARVSELALRTKVKVSNTEISPKILKALNQNIKEWADIVDFCVDHPQFKYVSVHQILSGKRKKLSKNVKALCEVLNVQL